MPPGACVAPRGARTIAGRMTRRTAASSWTAALLGLLVLGIGVLTVGTALRAPEIACADEGGGGRAAAGAPSAKGEHIEAELVSATTSFAPGTTATVGLRFKMDPHWHVYWENPGDSGLSPTVRWTLPPGFAAGPIRWPAPVRLRTSTLENFIYSGEVVLPVDLDVPRDAAGDAVLTATIEWLVCAEECVPGDATLVLRVPVRAGPPAADPRVAPLFAAALAGQPTPWTGAAPTLRAASGRFELEFPGEGPWSDPGAQLYVLPAAGDVAEHASPQTVRRENGRTIVMITASRVRSTPVDRVRGLLEVRSDGARHVYAFEAPPGGGPAVSAATPTSAPTPTQAGDRVESLALALLLAFLGGIVLNVMPCVLPVLSVKILGFVSQAGEDRARTLRHGLLFAGGVIVSFWALAGVLLLLRAGGELVGWGFHVQEPIVVGSLALLLLLLALNLFGVFEVGTSVAGAADGVARGVRSSGARAFADGAMATFIATPCTAPFMGSALTYALTVPAPSAMLVFTSLGVGMAAPYVLLSANPSWLRWVPKPGPWMVTFKQLMAFPVLATVVWLLWVFGKEAGVDGVAWMLAACLLVSGAAWVRGRWGGLERSTSVRWWVGTGVALLLAAFAVERMVHASHQEPGALGAPPAGWVAYGPGVVEGYQAKGRVVLLDFTAAWCTTCKVNEALVLGSDTVRSAVARMDVAQVQAD